jgi:hypothetical protein
VRRRSNRARVIARHRNASLLLVLLRVSLLAVLLFFVVVTVVVTCFLFVVCSRCSLSLVVVL